VFTNTRTLFKTVIISPALFPKLAILDAELTLKLPPSITAATGMDALTHAIESYVSKQANPVSQALALQAIKMICTHLPRAFFTGVDLHAREQMLLGSFLAGVAFAQSKLGNVHAISHTFGGVFNIPHGIANATLLPYVIEYNVVDHVVALNKAIGIPDNIKDLGVDLDYMPQMVSDSMRSGNVLVNPRLTSAADVERIIGNAFHGIHS
jgi:alcohol dehydrogenase